MQRNLFEEDDRSFEKERERLGLKTEKALLENRESLNSNSPNLFEEDDRSFEKEREVLGLGNQKEIDAKPQNLFASAVIWIIKIIVGLIIYKIIRLGLEF